MVDKGISLETDELLYTFQETGIEENHTWEIYSLKEYPDRSLLFADCVGFNSLVLSYAPELACEEDALEDARENDFVHHEKRKRYLCIMPGIAFLTSNLFLLMINIC